jgi:hypothetical protein
MHPAAGTTGKPSFAALVASVDPQATKYVAQSRVQSSRQEMIEDLREMCKVKFDVRRVKVPTDLGYGVSKRSNYTRIIASIFSDKNRQLRRD